MKTPITYVKNESGSGLIVVRAARTEILAKWPSAKFVDGSNKLEQMRRRGMFGAEWTYNSRNELTICAY